MAEKEFMMRLHGDYLHCLIIFVAKYLLVQKGAVLKDERQFKKRYLSPCEPDIFFEIEEVWHKGNKKVKQKVLYVIEVETNPTRQSITKKLQQYEESLAGVRLQILDLKDFDNHPADEMRLGASDIKDWVEKRLPI